MDSFAHASPSALGQLLKRYSVGDDWRGYICDDLEPPARVSLFGEAEEKLDVVKLTSPGCQASFLLTFWWYRNQWTYGGTIELNEHYGQHPRFEARKLFEDMPPAVVVDDNEIGSGTGISQYNTQIYMLVSGKMRVVFNQPVHSTLTYPSLDAKGGSYDHTQDSVFRFLEHPVRGERVQRENVILEKRTIVVNGQSFKDYYAYGWDPRLGLLTAQVYAPF